MILIIMHEEVQLIRHVDFFIVDTGKNKKWGSSQERDLMHFGNLIKTRVREETLWKHLTFETWVEKGTLWAF